LEYECFRRKSAFEEDANQATAVDEELAENESQIKSAME